MGGIPAGASKIAGPRCCFRRNVLPFLAPSGVNGHARFRPGDRGSTSAAAAINPIRDASIHFLYFAGSPFKRWCG